MEASWAECRPDLVLPGGPKESVGGRAQSLRFFPDCRLLRAEFGNHPDGLGLVALRKPSGALELLGESATVHQALEVCPK